jgi:hypothetical protein
MRIRGCVVVVVVVVITVVAAGAGVSTTGAGAGAGVAAVSGGADGSLLTGIRVDGCARRVLVV